MKFVFIFYDRPNYYGGPIINARRLLPELSRRGHEVHCLLFYEGDVLAGIEYMERFGVKCHSRALIGYTDCHIRWILRKVSELSPDIFVPNLLVSGWFAARWVREAGIPTIAVMRSDDPFYWSMVEQFVVGSREWAVSGLVCVSEGLFDEVQLKEPKYTKLCVIPSGVPVPNVTRIENPRSGRLKLVYVGRFVQEQKRILDMIDAFALVIRKYQNIEVTLIGNGRHLPEVKQRIDKYRLTEHINILGTVPCEEIQNRLIDYHVLVLLSDYEGTPGAVMDGMAAGLVPVCLDIPGGVRELVIHEQTGLLVMDRQESFVRAIGRLAVEDTLWEKLSANAKAHVKTNFSLEVAADRWETFCCELVNQAGSRRQLAVRKFFLLPTVRPEFAKQDRRRVSVLVRVGRALIHFFRR